MCRIIKIVIIFIYTLLLITSSHSNEIADTGTKTINKIKNKGKNFINKLTKISLKENEALDFLSNYVITIDEENGDGLVTYYFEDNFYKKYKDLVLLSKDKWRFTKFTKKIQIFNGKDKVIWKIQPLDESTISIKNKFNPISKLYKFSYQSKTDYHISLEEKKLNDIKLDD